MNCSISCETEGDAQHEINIALVCASAVGLAIGGTLLFVLLHTENGELDARRRSVQLVIVLTISDLAYAIGIGINGAIGLWQGDGRRWGTERFFSCDQTAVCASLGAVNHAAS